MPVWLLGFIGKVPRPLWYALGAVALAWWVYGAGARDASQRAAVAQEKALLEQGEIHLKAMGELIATMSAANAGVSKTEVRVIREVADARRELDALPNADVPVDADSWRVVHDRIERMRLHTEDDGADPPRGSAEPVG